jgi:hypothetical protein
MPKHRAPKETLARDALHAPKAARRFAVALSRPPAASDEHDRAIPTVAVYECGP